MPCDGVKAWLSAWEIEYTERDVTRDPDAVAELVRLGGAAPLTVIDGRPVSGLDLASLTAILLDDAAIRTNGR